ncbi:hypothetical protein PN463_14640 [Dolichospermum circinale CS-537/03]|nr:hypothetical protein [Dolichospermum circinale]MDB9479849.1 hypothetical protein [Dolichospermum circinale CS-537/03]
MLLESIIAEQRTVLYNLSWDTFEALMFVSKLCTDKWTGNRNEENCIENPNWQQIKTAICELDGNTKTLVSLEVDDESYSTSRCYEVQEPHPQPPPISKVYPFLPPAAGGLRGVRGGGLRCTS